eukprot:m.366348 g.366348  ORF g.366348 m.366348 type:complete len:73 (+) comp16659_c0_seq2:784-1002(+)
MICPHPPTFPGGAAPLEWAIPLVATRRLGLVHGVLTYTARYTQSDNSIANDLPEECKQWLSPLERAGVFVDT